MPSCNKTVTNRCTSVVPVVSGRITELLYSRGDHAVELLFDHQLSGDVRQRFLHVVEEGEDAHVILRPVPGTVQGGYVSVDAWGRGFREIVMPRLVAWVRGYTFIIL